MLIPSLFYGAVIGAATGIIWSFALSARVSVSMLTGAAVGAIAATLLALVGKFARAGGRLQAGEAYFVSNGLLTFGGVAAAAVGLLVWLVRAMLN